MYAKARQDLLKERAMEKFISKFEVQEAAGVRVREDSSVKCCKANRGCFVERFGRKPAREGAWRRRYSVRVTMRVIGY